MIHSVCNACEIKVADCTSEFRQQYTDNATALQDINKYGARLEYSCGLAKEFVMNGGGTKATIEMKCNWDSTWTPTASIGYCIWVACIEPPEPPANNHLGRYSVLL